jgi:putative transposase
MPQSHAYTLIHLIFSTKERRPFLAPDVRGQLNAYLVGVIKNIQCSPVTVNCVEDHVHILFFLARDVSLSQAVAKIKANSSRWLKAKSPGLARFSWQRGYSSFSVSKSNMPSVKAYIETQGQHHRKISFMDEVKKFLDKHGIRYDERYLWD